MSPDITLTLGEISSKVQGVLTGNANIRIRGVNDLLNACGDEISFLAHSKYEKQARSSGAAAILIPRGMPHEDFPSSLIEVEDPSSAFGVLVEHFIPSTHSWIPGIHPTAIVSENATVDASSYIAAGCILEDGVHVGRSTYVSSGCYLGADTIVGDGCLIHPRVTIRERTRIGSNVILQPGVIIGSDGFGYDFKDGKHQKIPQVGYVQIDDHVEIGANSTIDRGRFGKTWIKEGTKIDNLVMVAHNVSIGPHAIIVAQCGISGSSHLGAYVTMAGQSAVVGHVNIGDQVTLTGWTAVTKDIPLKGVYRGAPARPIRDSMKVEALTEKLPELYQRIRNLEQEVAHFRENA